QRDDQLGQHAADVSEQASPPRATGINHSFASDEFTCDGTDHRANKQADHSEEETNQRADNRPESAPLGRSEIFRPKIAAEKIEHVGKKCRSEEHTSELQSPDHLVCRLLLEKK